MLQLRAEAEEKRAAREQLAKDSRRARRAVQPKKAPPVTATPRERGGEQKGGSGRGKERQSVSIYIGSRRAREKS